MPGEIYNLDPLEKQFVYEATLLKIKEEEKAAKKAKKGAK